jgi:putative ABC transport system ATP-binding protein
MPQYILEAVEIDKSYTAGTRSIRVLEGISLSVSAGEFLVIEGKSGSGKSTLLSLLSGLDRPDAGRILLSGTDITGLPEEKLAPFRNRTIGFVFQAFHLMPSLTALENIMFPAELDGDIAAADKAVRLLDRVGLSARGDNFPHQLSGGEKQRVAICRALINNPAVVFADEPTGNLDSVNDTIVLNLLLELRREHHTTLILATHSSEIAGTADRVVQLVDGRIAV